MKNVNEKYRENAKGHIYKEIDCVSKTCPYYILLESYLAVIFLEYYNDKIKYHSVGTVDNPVIPFD